MRGDQGGRSTTRAAAVEAAATVVGAPLKILIVALNYAPEMVGCAKYTADLAEDLVLRGAEVHVVTGPPYYPSWSVEEGYSGARWSSEVRAGVNVVRGPLYVPAKVNGVKRVIHLASFGAAAFPTAISVAMRVKPDVVFGVAPTITAAAATLAAAKLSRAAAWLHVQDFEIDAAFELGLLKSPAAKRMALAFERFLLRRFDRVSSISSAMTRKLFEKSVKADRVVEFRNWVDVDAVRVFPSSNTEYRRQLNIESNAIVALYSGNMAGKQGIEALADVAAAARSFKRPVTLVFCGDGPARGPLQAACATLENVRFLPLQPLERLAELLATADIHLLPQKAEAADLVLPSKLTGMLASGRPVIAMAEPGSGLAAEVEGCGLTVAPTAKAMTAALLTLVQDPELRSRLGAAARVRAETRWRKTSVIDGFETELRRLISSHKAAVASPV